ncbi:hypothetical protein PINS_up008005 [Pythium insidiosum]|nr:hypothetical protein PINS_up008005 [Pythium insidiosum]
MPDLSDVAAATGSPAVSALGAPPPPPTVSPMAPAISQSLDEKAKTTKSQSGMNGGRWTEQEHQSFLAGLRLYGREWKKVASKIKTRTSAQIRSHAQKYFAKLARDDEARKQSGLLQHLQQHPHPHPHPHPHAQHSQPQPPHPHAGAMHSGYLSDGGSSTTTTTGNNSGDDAAETDHERPLLAAMPSSAPVPAQTRPMLPIHPYPTAATPASAAQQSPSPSTVTLLSAKKRARSLVGDLGPAKQRKTTVNTSPSSVDRLPSPEELLERVSPSVRQRLASLIEAEICALQVLSCCAWITQQQLQHQQQQQQQPHQPQQSLPDASLLSSMLGSSSHARALHPQLSSHQPSPHHLRSPHLASFGTTPPTSAATPSPSAFAASKSPAGMSFAMRTSSIF